MKKRTAAKTIPVTKRVSPQKTIGLSIDKRLRMQYKHLMQMRGSGAKGLKETTANLKKALRTRILELDKTVAAQGVAKTALGREVLDRPNKSIPVKPSELKYVKPWLLERLNTRIEICNLKLMLADVNGLKPNDKKVTSVKTELAELELTMHDVQNPDKILRLYRIIPGNRSYNRKPKKKS